MKGGSNMFYTDDPERDYEAYQNYIEKENNKEDNEDEEWDKADRDFDRERDEGE
jgi:hypothetical protein